ncbi:LOW QUALITY PROTEIN: ephrin-B2-like [Xyrichtys novacula]|uniref:Ephrin-B3 n=1 Tax=Xyrichtys novacula TaxID=13765 RepID=A0AAV1HLA7_XYRNO|nr:LOW QUALITY PROTEIN: ephrin-B2-like [Xyrichtys novacula]
MGLHMLGVRVEMACRRSGNALWILLVFLLDLLGTTASNMEPIYWNSLNERFRDDKGYVLYPQIGDRLDLICPPLDTARSTPEYEFYKLYLVSSREQADRCEVMGPPNIVLTCDEPTRERRFTIKFQEFSPNLWGHEFKSMHDYYIIATSDGTRQGLDSMRGGVCATQGMKVVLKVGQSQYGLPPKKDPPAGRTTSRNPGGAGNSTQSRPNTFGPEGSGENGPLQSSNIALIAGAAGGSAFLLLVTAVICVVCYRRRHAKHSDTHHPPLSLSSLTSPKRGGGGGISSSNNNGSEPSDIIIPLRTSDSAYCPHYEKVSGDYGHPVYIVQEMPPQSPANIYYKV